MAAGTRARAESTAVSSEVPPLAVVSVDMDTLSARAIDGELGGIRLPAVVLTARTGGS